MQQREPNGYYVNRKNEMKLRNYLRNIYVIDGEETSKIKGIRIT